MRFTAILLLALVCSSVLAVTNKMKVAATAKKIDELKKQGGWASIILDMAELHVQSSHPLDELKQALADVITDLQKKEEQAHQDYAARTEEHHETVDTLTSQINHAIVDITRSNDNLNDNLYPTVVSLQQSIAESEQIIDQSQASIAQKTKQREVEHAEFEKLLAENQEGIRIIEECIDVTKKVASGEMPSLAQVSARKEIFAKAQKVLQRHGNQEFVFAQALAQLANQSKEIDQAIIAKIIEKFNEYIKNLLQAQGQLQDAEAAAEQQFQNEKADLESTIADNRDNISSCEKQLEIVNEEIRATEEFIARRKADQAKFEKELQAENDAYDLYVNDYNNLINQIATEIAACTEALEILNKANFSDVIETRLNDGDHTTVDWQQSRDNSVSVFGEGYEGIPN